MQSLLMQYLIFGNNFTGTPSEHFQADECGKHPICENKISLNPQNTCSFMLVFTVSLLKRLRAVYFISKRMIKDANTKQKKNQRLGGENCGRRTEKPRFQGLSSSREALETSIFRSLP